ncbi:Mannosylglycerate hydrolase [uncultured Ruminococcus sp.]|nr:Mannosylglycerate hydrolase [uncultured Ruminococcus sp.]SCH22675.1 Mannosylglycerate hydrolase [uncultured Clostridium sp.]
MLERLLDIAGDPAPRDGYRERKNNPDVAAKRRVDYYRDRIIGEMKFAYLLSKELDGKYHELIRQAEQTIITMCGKTGLITPEAVSAAEEILLPIQSEAKSYQIICAAHAHIDMNWQWGWDETVNVVLDTLRTMLDIMEEYPDYKFSQSQASVYKIVEDYDPEMLEEIKQRVKEGRWEVTAATWVECDKNMPSGESLARQMLYAKEYLTSLFDLPEDYLSMDFEPDTFGHSVYVPEMLQEAGIKYYYHCRGKGDGEQLYRWVGKTGAEVLVNRETNFYFTNVDEMIAQHAFDLSKKSGIKTTLRVYGVGDHGGGPTRRDIERLRDMASWPIFPTVKMGTYREFFEIIEQEKDKLPVVTGELNFIFDGCFTSQSENKEGNRTSENELYSAELFNTVLSLDDVRYPAKDFRTAWQHVLLNQFHDIITGSGVADTRHYALGLYQEVRAVTSSKRKLALQKIAAKIDTSAITTEAIGDMDDVTSTRSYGSGVGSGQVERGTGKTRIFHFFNPAAKEREEVVEILLWEWYGDHNRLQAKDAEGNVVPCQLVDQGFNTYWWHKYQRLLVKVKVPACGYATYVISEAEIDDLPISYWWERRKQKREEFVLENDLIRVTLNPQSAAIDSVIDKQTGRELADQTRQGGVFQYILEANHKEVNDWRSEMSAWFTGRYKQVEVINKNMEMSVSKGILRNSVTYHAAFADSKLDVTVSLDDHERFLRYQVTCDWHEYGTEETGVPLLSFYLPMAYPCDTYRFDVPFGVIDRGENGVDVAANSFAAGLNPNGEDTTMVLTRSKYGFRCDDNAIMLPLLRCGFDPDPYPENGIYRFDFAVGFLNGIVSGGDLISLSQCYNLPMTVVSDRSHEGQLPMRYSFVSVAEGNGIVSGVKQPEQDGDHAMIARIYEPDGKAGRTVLKFDRPVKSVWMTDLHEKPVVCLDQNIEENCVAVELTAHKIATLRITF